MAPARSAAVLPALVALLGSIGWGPTASGQVPPGHFAMGAAVVPNGSSIPWTGSAGIFVGHPRNPGPMQAVTGLPAALVTRPATSTGFWGVSALAIHEPSGDLLVGDHTDVGFPVTLYRFAINRRTLAATQTGTWQLGVSGNVIGGDVNQVAQLDQDRVVVTGQDFAGAAGQGPMVIAEVNLATDVVTPWPVAGMFQRLQANAVCVDGASETAYVGGSASGTSPSQIYSIPVANRTTFSLVATVPTVVDNLLFDPFSRTILASGRLGADAIFRIDPATGTVTPLLTNWQNAPSIAREPTTGELLFGGVQLSVPGPHGVYHFAGPGIAPTFLSNTYGAGATPGAPLALVVASDPAPYGAATSMPAGLSTIDWSPGPLAGRLPLVGNATFQIELAVPASVTLQQGLWAASPALAPEIVLDNRTTTGYHVARGPVRADDQAGGFGARRACRGPRGAGRGDEFAHALGVGVV